MLRLASLIRSAIRRRSPMTFISVVSAASALGGGGAAVCKSARMIRPPGPEPATVVRSMPASLARRRLAGEVITRPGRAAGAAAGADVGAAGLATDAGGGAGAAVLTAGAAADAAGAAAASGGFALSLNSNTISGEPTATLSPGAPVTDTTRPLTGAGTSTAALSVITSTIS